MQQIPESLGYNAASSQMQQIPGHPGYNAGASQMQQAVGQQGYNAGASQMQQIPGHPGYNAGSSQMQQVAHAKTVTPMHVAPIVGSAAAAPVAPVSSAPLYTEIEPVMLPEHLMQAAQIVLQSQEALTAAIIQLGTTHDSLRSDLAAALADEER
jgi:hypothetical protein